MALDPVLSYTVELYRQGFSLRKIARMVSSRFNLYISKDWVRRKLIALGVYVPKRSRSNQVSHTAYDETIAGLLLVSRKKCSSNQVSHGVVSCCEETSARVSHGLEVTSSPLSHGVDVTPGPGVSSSVSRHPRPSLLGMVSRRILEAAARLRVFTPSTLAFYLKLDPHLVKKYLWRLRRTGYVERIKRGLYRVSNRICSLLPLICSSKAPDASKGSDTGQNVIGEAGGGAPPAAGFGGVSGEDGSCGVNGLVLYVPGHCGFVCLSRRGFRVVGSGMGGKLGFVFEVLGRRVRVLCGYSGGCEVIVSGSFSGPGELEGFLEALVGELSGVLGVEVGVVDLSVLRVDLHCDLWRGSLQFRAGQFTAGDLVAYLKGGVDGDGPLRIERRIRRRKNEMSVEDLLNLFQAHVDVAGSIAKLHREIAEVKAGLKRVLVETVFNKQPVVCTLSEKDYEKIVEAAWRGLGPGLKQQLRQLWEAGLVNVIEPLYKQAVIQCGEIVIKKIIPELIKALKKNKLVLDKETKYEDYTRHPGWKKLYELIEVGLISVDLEKGMVYYSPDLWKYIRTRTPAGTMRGLDKRLLTQIRDHHGEWAVKLLLTIQMYGGKIDLEKALDIITHSY